MTWCNKFRIYYQLNDILGTFIYPYSMHYTLWAFCPIICCIFHDLDVLGLLSLELVSHDDCTSVCGYILNKTYCELWNGLLGSHDFTKLLCCMSYQF